MSTVSPEPIIAEHAPAAFAAMVSAIIDGPYNPALEQCLLVTRQGIRDNFTSSANPDNADWPPRGFHSAFFGGRFRADDGHPLLIDTGALLQAAVGSGTGAMSEVGSHEMSTGVSGSMIPYAAAQNYGYPENNLPQREFLGVREDRIDQMEDIIADFVLDTLLMQG